MTAPSAKKQPQNLPRAVMKITLIVAGLLALAGLLAMSVDSHALNQLKLDMSLWSLIAVVLIINIVSFAVFIILFFAYQWVRCDLGSARVSDERDEIL